MVRARPKVSVIIPVYNGERFLSAAVDSIVRQDYDPLEVVIVDDGSTDHTAAVVANLPAPVRYFRRQHRGAPAARNTAIRNATGEVLAFLDADDLWPEGKLELQVGMLEARPEVEVVFGWLQMLMTVAPGDGTSAFEPWGGPRPGVNLGCGLFRRGVFDRIGLFDETQLHADDVEWLLRAKENRVAIATISEVTLLYRRHGNNITNERATDHHFLLRALKTSLDRRRRSSLDGHQVLSEPPDSSGEGTAWVQRAEHSE